MASFYLIIPVALIFCVIAVKVFFWAIDNHQFDDLENEGKRILFDDDMPPPAAAPKDKSADAHDD